MTEITVTTSLDTVRDALAEARSALSRIAANTTCLEGEVETVERGLNYADIVADNVAKLAQRMAVVDEFLAERAEFVTTLRQCVGDSADYHRWQGHAEARSVLSEQLGLPVAWPAEQQGGAVQS